MNDINYIFLTPNKANQSFYSGGSMIQHFKVLMVRVDQDQGQREETHSSYNQPICEDFKEYKTMSKRQH